MRILYPFAKRFIAGEDRQTAVRNIKALEEKGYLATVDILGEHVQTEGHAESAKNEYLKLLDEGAILNYPLDLSVKVSQMGLDISEDICKKNLEEILEKERSHTVRLDMEGSDYTQRTIDAGVALHQTHKNLGLVLQASLFRTDSDLESLLPKGISVRLCKGAYKEPERIAYQSLDKIQENFLNLAYKILREGHLPAIATHDEYLIGKIIEFVNKEQIPPESFYFELLYGVRRDLQKVLLEKGYQVRIYVPYGKSWLPYTLRRLGEGKNLIFVIKNLLRETLGLGKIP
ncbi:MAG: proline dehydrogenase family protein [Nitrospinae bacterium]|nr:proline dehydrogenase family protein [Nitrospinota bacterium]